MRREILRPAADRELLQCAPCELGDPRAFDDTPAPANYFNDWPDHGSGNVKRTSEAVTRRILSSCAGWPRRPTASEFYDAVRATTPTRREKALISMWAVEASSLDLFDAWGEHVYTWRALVAAFHRASPLNTYQRFRELNRMAMVESCDGIPLWTG